MLPAPRPVCSAHKEALCTDREKNKHWFMHLRPPREWHKPSWCPCIQETTLALLHSLGDVQNHMWLPPPQPAASIPHGHNWLWNVSGIMERSRKGFLVLPGNFGTISCWEEVASGIELSDLGRTKSAPLKTWMFTHEHTQEKSKQKLRTQKSNLKIFKNPFPLSLSHKTYTHTYIHTRKQNWNPKLLTPNVCCFCFN